VEWQWQGKTEELREKPVPVPLCPPQILHGLTHAWNHDSEVTGRRLTAWTTAQPRGSPNSYMLRTKNSSSETQSHPIEMNQLLCRFRTGLTTPVVKTVPTLEITIEDSSSPPDSLYNPHSNIYIQAYVCEVCHYNSPCAVLCCVYQRFTKSTDVVAAIIQSWQNARYGSLNFHSFVQNLAQERHVSPSPTHSH
jgi:hypothetical protein